MKRVVAVIREERFEIVKEALLEKGYHGMNVSYVKGRGSKSRIKESYRGSSYCIDLIPKTRIELIINDEYLDEVIDIILENAKTGNVGDGKIFVSDVEEVIRIRTGENGSRAV